MICTRCDIDKPAGDFIWKTNGRIANGQKCKECMREIRDNPEWKDRQRDNHLKRLYGISAEEYDTFYREQGGVCAVCKQESDASGKNSKLHVDHDHDTKKVRGLLCYRCNIALGYLAEDEKRIYQILDYLSIHVFK